MSKPKVIIGILMHDSGRQLGCYGAPDAITPNMDRMAKEGVRFQHHYSTGTVCIPSRASVLTGNCLHNASICFYDHTVTTLPRVLKTAGYKTLRCGFAEEKEYRPIAGGPYPHGDFNVSGTSLLGYDQSITDSSQAADVVEYIKNALKEQNGPIYIAAAFTEAHSPYDLPVTEDDIDAAVLPPKLPQLPDTRPAREMLARFNKAVTAADKAIGAIMGFIEDNGLYEDTLMYVSSDHGIDFPRAKQSCYDSGIGVPLIFWGGSVPGIKGHLATGLSSHVDIMPTLCDIVGSVAPKDISGVSQLPQFFDNASPREYCISEVSYDNINAPVRAIRTDRFKYIVNFNPGIPVATGNDFTRKVGTALLNDIYNTPRPSEELYDLESDPSELDNLASNPDFEREKLMLRDKLFSQLAFEHDEIFRADSVYSSPVEQFAVGTWYKKPDGAFELRKDRS